MIWKAIILLSCALCVLGDGPAISEQRIKIIHKEHHKEHQGHHGELTHIGSKKPEHHEEYAWSYPSYEFSYKVHDPHTHDMKGQEESRDGDMVKGEYWLVEPDGRKRTVTYHADKHSGFHATVHYSDDHHHYEHKEEKKEEGGDGGAEGAEEGGEAQEGEGDGNAEAAGGEEGVGDGAEESRGREEEVGRWIHDRHWGHRGYEKRRDEIKYDMHGDDRRHDDHKLIHYSQIRGDAGHRREVEHKDVEGMSILSGLGNYGRREGRERADWHGRGKYEVREETRGRPTHHKMDEQRAYPRHKAGSIVRENYMHPRFYRHNQEQRQRASH